MGLLKRVDLHTDIENNMMRFGGQHERTDTKDRQAEIPVLSTMETCELIVDTCDKVVP
jgi:hypothetical protein